MNLRTKSDSWELRKQIRTALEHVFQKSTQDDLERRREECSRSSHHVRRDGRHVETGRLRMGVEQCHVLRMTGDLLVVSLLHDEALAQVRH